MNNALQEYARNYLKTRLNACTDGEVLVFKRMYSHENLDKDINLVVDDMPEDKLDWAMEQVRRTVEKK